jgi:hypothetical protein
MPDPRPPIVDDERYLLGKIAAVVEALPARMDKFEHEMNANMHGFHSRLASIEQTQAGITAARAAHQRFTTVVAAFIGSVCSGAGVWFLGRH